jgi:hypothetical protein
MNETLEPVIHIGYGRAGSTSVQTVLGNPDAGFAVGKKLASYAAEEVKDKFIVNQLVTTHDLEFDPAIVREYALGLLGWARAAGKVPAISSERLAGHFCTGGHDAAIIANRLYGVWPKAKIFVVFREQKAMLDSIYRQYARKGGGRSIDDFLNPKGKGHLRGPGFSLRFLKYDQIISHYQQLFGREQVLALPLEYLKNDLDGFFQRLFTFSGVTANPEYKFVPVHENTGINAYQAKCKRLFNPIMQKDYLNDYGPWCNSVTRNIAKPLYKLSSRLATASMQDREKLRLQEKIKAACKDYFRESNSRLVELVEMPLSKYGYDA